MNFEKSDRLTGSRFASGWVLRLLEIIIIIPRGGGGGVPYGTDGDARQKF